MTTDDNRDEHLARCKRRALAYVEAGDLPNAIAAMRSDLATHPETADHPRIRLGKALLMHGHLGDRETCRRWIEGFN